jgi:hypothetical protein
LLLPLRRIGDLTRSSARANPGSTLIVFFRHNNLAGLRLPEANLAKMVPRALIFPAPSSVKPPQRKSWVNFREESGEKTFSIGHAGMNESKL